MVLQFSEGRTSFCRGLISRKLCRDLPVFLTGFSSFSAFPLFSSFFPYLCLYAQFLMLCHLTKMRFSRSTHLLIYLSLEILTSTIKTDSPILVELIDLVNYVIIVLPQMALFKLLTFLPGFL